MCFDAPCTHACPTHIDIPKFIKKIHTGNLRGSARTILESNLLGATCARVCPVQELCEGAWVLGADTSLFPLAACSATPWTTFTGKAVQLFSVAQRAGKSIAVMGAGPPVFPVLANLPSSATASRSSSDGILRAAFSLRHHRSARTGRNRSQ